MSDNATMAAIEQAFRRRGQDHYGEGVSQQEHALQAAWLAEQAGAPAALVVAALLHDIGPPCLPSECTDAAESLSK